MIKKRKYQFRAMLIELTDGASSKVIDEYAFFAVSDLGAKRAASEWYNRIRPEDRLPWAMPSEWRFLGAIEQNKHFRLTPSGLALVVVPLGSSESDEAVEQMKALMAEIRRDPQVVRKRYRADDLLARLEQYFRYCIDEVGGEITDQVRRDADLVYDWPNAPAMLVRALDRKPGQLRKLLGRLRDLRCPNCNQTFVILDERCKGGFIVEDYLCRRCQVELVEYQPEDPRLRGDWRNSD
ncbi:MAG: hypothetical protein BroJett011_19590 [Chloroflexota bacterium]|jgi:hypothetical protein|nr:MAG: hypothetical protein BroJett011_19590 [Chloroflexota bacterium]